MKRMKNLVNKYRTLPIPARASLCFVLCSILQKGISVITTPFFTRLLSKEEYGTLSVYNTWLAIVTVFATLEMSSGVFNKAMIKYEDRDGYTSSCLFLSSAITLVLFLIYLPFKEQICSFMGLETRFLYLMFISVFFTSAISLWTAKLRFSYNYIRIVLITIFTSAISTIVSIIFVINSKGDKAYARLVGSLLVTTIVYGIVYIKVFYDGRTIIKKDSIKFTISNSVILIPHYLSQIVLNQSDRLMIDNYCGKSDAAMYSLAYQLAIMMRFVTDAIHSSFMPWTFQRYKAEDYDAIKRRSIQIELFIGFICVLFSLFGPEFILILGGSAYQEAVYVVPPVSMSILLITVYSFFGNIEFYYEKTKLISSASIGIAILNIGLNAIFIPMVGYLAAGYTTLVCYLIYCIIHYLFMSCILKREGGVNPYKGKEMFFIITCFLCISIGISFLYQYTIIRYIAILLVALVSFTFFLKNQTQLIGK